MGLDVMKATVARLRNILRKLLLWVDETPRNAFAHRGQDVYIARALRATFPRRVKPGSYICIGPYAFLSSQGGLAIEDGMTVRPCLTAHTANHNCTSTEAIPYDAVTLPAPVVTRQNIRIGGNVIVAPGVTIGEGAAGAAVAKDAPELAGLRGNPPKVIKYRDKDICERLATESRIDLRVLG
jgi:acetyltransferase-like isoleucine patch superfamily enzyme